MKMGSQNINGSSYINDIQDILSENDNLDEQVIGIIKESYAESTRIECRVSNIKMILNALPTLNEKKGTINVALIMSIKCLKHVLETIGDTLDSANFETSSYQVKASLTENLQLLIDILELFIILLNYVMKSSPMDLSTVENLPINIGGVLLDVFSHCKNSETMYASYFQQIGLKITSVFKKCHELQSLYFIILTEHITMDFSQEKQIDIFIEVLDTIVDIGKVVISLDVKTMAEEWKGYTKLCEQHADWLKDKFVHHKATEFLCIEIQNTLNGIISNEMSDSRNTTRSLKICNFILKILIKLSEIFNGYLSLDLKHFVDMLCSVHRFSSPNLVKMDVKKSLIEDIHSHITVGAEPLLISLIEDVHFRRSFITEIKQADKDKSVTVGYLLLTISIIKLLLQVEQQTRRLWTEECEADENIMCCLFDILPLCHIDLTSNLKFACPAVGDISLYDYTLIHLASLAVSCQNIQDVHDRMLAAVLQTNIWTALMAVDLFVIITRYGSADFCFEQTSFLITIYRDLYKSGLLHNSPQNIYLSQLLKDLFNLLPDKMKLKVQSAYPIVENIEVWIVIGVDSLPDEEGRVESEKTIDITSSYLKSFNDKRCSKEEYQKMVNYLQLLKSVPSVDSDSPKVETLNQLIVNAWQSIVGDSLMKYVSDKECCVQGSQWLNDHIMILSSTSAFVGCDFSNQQWIEVLQIITSYMKKSQSCIKLSVLELLKTLAHYEMSNDKFENEFTLLIADLFRELLNDKTELIRAHSMETFAYFARNTSSESVVSKTVHGQNDLKERVTECFKKKMNSSGNLQSFKVNYLQQCINAQFSHRCGRTVIFNDKTELIRAHSMETFAYFARNTSSESVVSKTVHGQNDLKERVTECFKKKMNSSGNLQSFKVNYLQQCINAQFSHRCEKLTEVPTFNEDFELGDVEDIFSNDFDGAPRKKQKIEFDDDAEVSSAIERIKKEAEFLKAHFCDRRINEAQKHQLSLVLGTINSLVKT